MNRQKLTLVALLLIGFAAMVNAAQFSMNLYFTEFYSRKQAPN